MKEKEFIYKIVFILFQFKKKVDNLMPTLLQVINIMIERFSDL